MTSNTQLHIRPAAIDDVPLVLQLINALAEYEKLSHEVVATEAALEAHLFGSRPYADALIALWDGEPAGFALFFYNYSTFLAQPGLYLEDLFVLPKFRRRGIGTALFARLAKIALEGGCGRFEWSVLDWNESAIAFYEEMGARVQPDWRICRRVGSGLPQLAARDVVE